MNKLIALAIAFLICSALLASTSRSSAVGQGDLIPVLSGTSVTVYEQTGSADAYTFPVSDLIGSVCTFYTGADELYTVSSDGTYLKIHCFRANRLSGDAVGNNIVAVRLNSVQGSHEALWASAIIDYVVGFNGIPESRLNALGPDAQVGPYEDRIATLMGDQDSELVLGFSPPPVTLDVELTGGFDYLFEEKATIRIAALVENAENMQPRLDASVTIQIYYPDGTLWVSDHMAERLTGTGIYEWESSGTISELGLPVGGYLVHVKASVGDGPVAYAILAFHIDPPSETEPSQPILWTYYAASIIAAVAGTTVGVALFKRRRKTQTNRMIRH